MRQNPVAFNQSGMERAALKTDRSAIIVGPQRFSNEILSRYLQSNSEIKCCCKESLPEALALIRKDGADKTVVLYDFCAQDNWQRGWKKNELFGKEDRPHFLPAIFNVCKDKRVEEVALRQGVRGVFYSDDDGETLLKGIAAIFSGELWVQRKVLEQLLLSDVQGSAVEPGPEAQVTSRESEVLALIAGGAKNDDIADSLCISPHTVKTHIYHIYKKIGVPNRLQAALWASKHLI